MSNEPTRDAPSPANERSMDTRDPDSSIGELTEAIPARNGPAGTSRYQIQELIAVGGMGSVYSALDTALNRPVALKVLLDRFALGSATARRFVEESRITGQLQHPNIPAVHDLGTLEDGRPFLAMKLIKGETLEQLLKQRPDPNTDRGRFLAIFEQVCHAVGYAHAHRVIHRDLKPSNIMVGAHGEVQVMDWGLAKILSSSRDEQPSVDDLDQTAAAVTSIDSDRDEGSETRAGSVLGTPAFMPPEQAIGAIDQVDARSDVFGLGAILCVILTGKPPFVAATSEAVRQLSARGQLAEAFTRLESCGAEPDLIALCRRCLDPERSQRPADAEDVAQAVAQLRAAADERARRAEIEREKAEVETREQRKRRRVQLALAAAVGVLMFAGGVAGLYADRQIREARERRHQSSTAIAAVLDRAAEALAAENPKLATGFLDDASKRAEQAGITDHDARIASYRRDRDMLFALAEVDTFRWTPRENTLPDYHDVAAKWAAALAGYGIVPGQTTPSDAAAMINASAIRTSLLTTLDGWLSSSPSPELREMLLAADPDPFRDEVRRALAANDAGALKELAARPEWSAHPPGLVQAVGDSQHVPTDRKRSLLTNAVRQRPTDFGLLMQLGGIYRINTADSADERLRLFQAALALRPDNVVVLNNLGVALFDNQDPDGAIAAYREAIRLDPKDALPHNNVGIALYGKGQLDGAIAAYREAIRLDPKYALAHDNLGAALKNKGDLDGAIAAYREAIRLDPKDATAHNNLGLVLKDKGDLDGAIAAYREAIRLDPKYALAHNNLGVLFRDRGELDLALDCFNKAIQIDPTFAWPVRNIGTVLKRSNDYDGAVLQFRKAIAIDPKYALPHSDLGLALKEKGDFDGAIAAYREAIRLDPKYASPHNNLGNALKAKGDLDGAIAAYREAIRLDPNYALAKSNLNRAERAKTLLPRLPAVLAGEERPAPAELCEFARLCCEAFQKRFRDAVRLFEQAFAADPKLADDLAKYHRYDAACSAAQSARGEGVGTATAPAERAALRAKALGWLRADLALRVKQAQSSTPADRQLAAGKLTHWLRDPDLVTLRPGVARLGMPADERATWDALWTDVRAAIATAQKPAPTGKSP